MEYKKVIKMLGNTPNQPLKFKTKTWLKKKEKKWFTWNV